MISSNKNVQNRRIVHKTRRSDLPYAGKSLSFNQKVNRDISVETII